MREYTIIGMTDERDVALISIRPERGYSIDRFNRESIRDGQDAIELRVIDRAAYADPLSREVWFARGEVLRRRSIHDL